MCMLEKVKEYELFPFHISENRGLVYPYRHQTSTAAQKHDLLNFHHVGRELFEQQIQAYHLKNPNVMQDSTEKKNITNIKYRQKKI